ncbi:MAG: FG-GAP-like repeat-containing protein, partial [Reinekea sp.]
MVTTEGHLQGQFTVSQGGAATYSLPIKLVTGPGGLVPAISVNYYSQSGNGLLGKGWSLSATEVISRCKPVGRAANAPAYNANDTLCLNGDELRKSHTYGGYDVYRKRIDDGTMVQATANGFTVYNEAGRVKEFNQQQFKSGSNSIVKAWYLSQVSQPGGASYTLQYNINNADGEVLLSKIMYGAHSVIFHYEQRPDRAFGFDSGGAKFSRTQRLSRIEVLGNGQDAGAYLFNYGYNARVDQSYLTHIQKCAEGGCLAPLSFEWSAVSDHLVDRQRHEYKIFSKYSDGFAFGDVDGNGTADIVAYDDEGDGYLGFVKTSYSSSATFSGVRHIESHYKTKNVTLGHADQDGVLDILVRDPEPGNDDVYAYMSHGKPGTSHTNNRTTVDDREAAFIDINGDGISDLVQWVPNADREDIYIRRGDGQGGYSGRIRIPKIKKQHKVFFGDVNGDGKTDMMLYRCQSGKSELEIRFGWGNTNSIGYAGYGNARLNSNSLACDYVDERAHKESYMIDVYDVNGDGLDDIVETLPVGSNNRRVRTGQNSFDVSSGTFVAKVFLSTGTGVKTTPIKTRFSTTFASLKTGSFT